MPSNIIASSSIISKDDNPTPQTPAVVSSSRGVTLADRLNLSNLPLATTPGGRNFCLKALHPSEHTIKAARVPGGNKPSVAMCCDMVMTIPITAANAEVNIFQMASPLHPCYVAVGAGGVSTFYVFFNSAFGGSVVTNPTSAAYTAAKNSMVDKIQNYRVTSQSMTAELIAPGLSDQGTVTSAQYTLTPKTCGTADAYIGSDNHAHVGTHPDIYVYPSPPLPSQMILGTSAYTNIAREGCYQPLKLSSFKWKDFNDQAVFREDTDTRLQTYGELDYDMSTIQVFPIYMNSSAYSSWTDVVPLPKLTSDVFGMTHFTGMAANVAIRIRVRQVVEITCRPSTLYAPLVEAPLPPDRVAMEMYSEISGRLKDGYPASWNSFGTLAKAVVTLGSQLLPFVEPALHTLSSAMKGSKNKTVSVLGSLLDTVAPGVGAGAVKAAEKVRKARKKAKAKAKGKN